METTDPRWTSTVGDLVALQERLATVHAAEWRPDLDGALFVAGVFVTGATGSSGVGAAGDPLWAGSALVRVEPGSRPTPVEETTVRGIAGAPYEPGLLALRLGTLLERAVRELDRSFDVLLVNATGRDHPRRFGLAVHAGMALDTPSVGVTDRPLLASASMPAAERGSFVPLLLDGEPVGAVVRTRRGAKPVVVHAGWRTTPDTARSLVLLLGGASRTPEPIRLARKLARRTRAADEGRAPHGETSRG